MFVFGTIGTLLGALVGLASYIPFLSKLGFIKSAGSFVWSFLKDLTLKDLAVIAVVAFFAWAAGAVHGHRKENAKWKAYDKMMKLAAEKRDAEIEKSIREQVSKTIADLNAHSAALEKKVSDYEKTLSAKDTGFRLRRDDVDGLRRIK
jgi:hypothetical protein